MLRAPRPRARGGNGVLCGRLPDMQSVARNVAAAETAGYDILTMYTLPTKSGRRVTTSCSSRTPDRCSADASGTSKRWMLRRPNP
jgi:hypothetical protein